MRRTEMMPSSPWFAVPRERPAAATRLYCFPHAGTGTGAYRGWGDEAAAFVEVAAVQLPGREAQFREPLHTSVNSLVPQLAHAIATYSDRPYALYGHSLGATLAFETARVLRRLGAPAPSALFVSASRAPQLPWPHAPIRHLDELDFLREVGRRYDAVPDELLRDAELRELMTPILRADMTIVETYRYEAEVPFAFPLVAFAGESDGMVTIESMDRWREQTTGEFRLRRVASRHLFLQSHRAELLREVSDTLTRIPPPSLVGARP